MKIRKPQMLLVECMRCDWKGYRQEGWDTKNYVRPCPQCLGSCHPGGRRINHKDGR